ncbi:unnamed protein product [Lathyrus oleraceus]
MDKFKVVFYSYCCFVKDPNIRYDGGEVYAFTGQNPDYWSFFKACDLVKVIDPEFDLNYVKIWWKHDEGSFKEDLKPFGDDGDVSELAMYAIENNCEVEISCESKPITGEATFMDKVKEKGKGKTCDEVSDKLSESNGDSSDESARGVHFDDSEEKRMKRFIEGYDKGLDAGVDDDPRTEHVANNKALSEPDKKMFIT